MEFKTLKNGFKLPVLGLGTFGIGGLMEKDSTLDNESIEVIKEVITWFIRSIIVMV